MGGALCAALGLAACAAPTPMTVQTAFTDRVATTPAKAAPVANCYLHVVELTDARREPGMIGVVSGRAVKAPEDTNAWLHSIVGSLDRRGFGVAFDGDVPQGAIRARISLRSAWINDSATNKTANVVLHVQAERAGEPPLDRDYRGSLSRINWAGTVGELQRLVDDAFVQALDAMATDVRGLCERPA
jgi:hypothetical protein